MQLNIKSAYLEITNICNLDCRSCYNRSGRHHQRSEISLNDIKYLTTRLKNEFSCSSVSLAGGEPTLHAQFNEILTYLLSTPDLEVGVVTNGTTGQYDIVQAYNAYPQLRIQVSLDGSDEESNAAIRGSGNFDKAIAFLQSLNCAGGTSKAPTMKMVLSSHNIDKLEEYYRLAISMGCEPDFSLINPMGNASDDWESLELTAKQKLYVTRTIVRLNKIYNKNVPPPACLGECPFTDENTALSVLVKCDGSVYPCQMLYDNDYSIGNILHDDDAHFAARYADISHLAKERIKKQGDCLKCLARHSCHRGCMGLSVMRHNGPLGDDGSCGFRKLQVLDMGLMSEAE